MTIKETIYALNDANGVRYVGKTTQRLRDRMYAHKSEALRYQHSSKEQWLASLYVHGKRPRVEVLEVVPVGDGAQAERKWVAHFEAAGCDLVNTAPAGAGATYRRVVDWAEHEHLFGVLPDNALAEMVGVTRKAVAYQRYKRGIAACGNRPEFHVAPPPMGGWNRIELPTEVIGLLGTMADQKLAGLAGVSKSCVMRERQRRGIASWSEQNNHPTQYKTGNFPERWLGANG